MALAGLRGRLPALLAHIDGAMAPGVRCAGHCHELTLPLVKDMVHVLNAGSSAGGRGALPAPAADLVARATHGLAVLSHGVCPSVVHDSWRELVSARKPAAGRQPARPAGNG